MITINKTAKWDAMIPEDWEFYPGLNDYGLLGPTSSYGRKAGFTNTWASGDNANAWSTNGYGIMGQGAWILASFTQEEIDYIMNNSVQDYMVSEGTFPITASMLYPTMTTLNGVTTIEFKDKCVLLPNAPLKGTVASWRTQIKAVPSVWSSKYKIEANYTGHISKPTFTHLVYVFGRGCKGTIAMNDPETGTNRIKGKMYIDTRQFAAFTVGLEGSSADIIMSDTTITPGKTIFFGNTPDTKIVVTMTTTLDVI